MSGVDGDGGRCVVGPYKEGIPEDKFTGVCASSVCAGRGGHGGVSRRGGCRVTRLHRARVLAVTRQEGAVGGQAEHRVPLSGESQEGGRGRAGEQRVPG